MDHQNRFFEGSDRFVSAVFLADDHSSENTGLFCSNIFVRRKSSFNYKTVNLALSLIRNNGRKVSPQGMPINDKFCVFYIRSAFYIS
jgi:hypothetical protein